MVLLNFLLWLNPYKLKSLNTKLCMLMPLLLLLKDKLVLIELEEMLVTLFNLLLVVEEDKLVEQDKVD